MVQGETDINRKSVMNDGDKGAWEEDGYRGAPRL